MTKGRPCTGWGGGAVCPKAPPTGRATSPPFSLTPPGEATSPSSCGRFLAHGTASPPSLLFSQARTNARSRCAINICQVGWTRVRCQRPAAGCGAESWAGERSDLGLSPSACCPPAPGSGVGPASHRGPDLSLLLFSVDSSREEYSREGRAQAAPSRDQPPFPAVSAPLLSAPNLTLSALPHNSPLTPRPAKVEAPLGPRLSPGWGMGTRHRHLSSGWWSDQKAGTLEEPGAASGLMSDPPPHQGEPSSSPAPVAEQGLGLQWGGREDRTVPPHTHSLPATLQQGGRPIAPSDASRLLSLPRRPRDASHVPTEPEALPVRPSAPMRERLVPLRHLTRCPTDVICCF